MEEGYRMVFDQMLNGVSGKDVRSVEENLNWYKGLLIVCWPLGKFRTIYADPDTGAGSTGPPSVEGAAQSQYGCRNVEAALLYSPAVSFWIVSATSWTISYRLCSKAMTYGRCQVENRLEVCEQ